MYIPINDVEIIPAITNLYYFLAGRNLKKES